MKKRTKLGLGGIALLFGGLALGGCTATFCSPADTAHIMYMYDFGVTEYHATNDEGTELLAGFDNVYVSYSIPEDQGSGIGAANNAATQAGLSIPSLEYWKALDNVVLRHALAEYTEASYESLSTSDVNHETILNALDKFGYLKFYDSSVTEETKRDAEIYANWDLYNQEVRDLIKTGELTMDDCASADYIKIYKSQLQTMVANNRACIALDEGKYGYYGYGSNKDKVTIEAKDWGYAWNAGFLEGLLVYPVAWLTETFVNLFRAINVPGLPQLLAILVVTFIIRGLMLAVTIKQTTSNAKMTELQPEIAKIQAKYPNANTNQYEKQQMSQQMAALYKKNKINPLSSILVLIVQFPVFVCVWSALQGSASLATDSFFGLYLSDSISSVLFNGSMWNVVDGHIPALTALILFILMAGTQVVSMLMPQWMQKRKTKNMARLGKNPAKKEQDNKMKWFTYIMMIMIIFMGFSLASAMGVYWLVGAIFSICQTLITNAVTERKSKK